MSGIGDCVYFIRSKNLVKIGHTKNLKSRLRGIRTGNPHGVDCIAVIILNRTFERAVQVPPHLIEKQAHDHFKDRRVTGEWFNISDDEVYDFTEKFNGCESGFYTTAMVDEVCGKFILFGLGCSQLEAV